MNLKRIILTACLLFMLWPVAAIAKEEPIIYTVKQGDTLWDISQRFIKDPYYWPNLWSNNPAIGNPHLIYPGQKLRIYDGRIEIIPVGEGAGEIGAAFLTEDEILLIPTYGGAQSFISSEEVETLGTLVDTVDNRVMVTTGDTVFLEMKDLAATSPGDVFELIEIGPGIIHPLAEGKWGHQRDDAIIGYQTVQLGTVEITKVTPTVAVATITNALREIERGSKLHPYEPIPSRVQRLFADTTLEGYILANDLGNVAMGQWQIILIDIGEESGLMVGHELDIYRKREATEQADRDKVLVLPDIDLGDAIVLEVRKGFAEALITRTTNLPIYRGDQIRTKTR
jgi:hypothetical protein